MSLTLIAYPLDDSNTEVAYTVDTMGDADIAITFSIDDINDITKRRGSFSKTIQLPNSITNAKLFKFAYNVQSFVGGFQPNKKIRAAMWEDGVQVFSGAMQLLSMAKTKGQVIYEVGLFSEDISLFQIAENNLLVNTAGVTGMNHTVTAAHVSATWNTNASGYVYGLVDAYGYTDVLTQGWFAVPYWKMGPSIYVKKMVDLIFAQVGYRYSSTFLNSTLFNKLVIPYSAGVIPAIVSGSDFFVANTSGQNFSGTFSGFLNFTNESSPYYDRGSYWNSTTSTFSAPTVPTRFNVKAKLRFGQITHFSNSTYNYLYLYNTTTSSTVGGLRGFQANASGTNTITWNDQSFDPSSNYQILMTGVGSTACNLVSGSTLEFQCIENPASLGVVDMRSALPADVKQSDLLVDLQKMFNLYFMPDAKDPKLLYIEPFKDFYTSTAVDWSQKADENQEQVLTNGDPNQYKSLIFKYKDMGDYLSKTYNSSYPLA